MLQLINIVKKFHHQEVLRNLSCRVAPGDFVIIMGPNGTGKTTLFDIIAGKVAPDKGSLFLDGVDITTMKEGKRALLIGRLFQNTYQGTCSSLTVRENLALAALKGRRAGFRLATELFSEEWMSDFLVPLGLEEILDVSLGLLSGGQRQMVAFIMTILKPIKLLLLDEPTAALDPNAAAQLLLFAQKYAQRNGVPILLITHDPVIAQQMGDRLWMLGQGSIQKEFGSEKKTLPLETLLGGG